MYVYYAFPLTSLNNSQFEDAPKSLNINNMKDVDLLYFLFRVEIAPPRHGGTCDIELGGNCHFIHLAVPGNHTIRQIEHVSTPQIIQLVQLLYAIEKS